MNLADPRLERAQLKKKTRQTTNHWEDASDSMQIACSYELNTHFWRVLTPLLGNRSNRERSAALIATQGICLRVVNETLFRGIKSDPPAKLPADRGGEAGHVTIPNSRRITDRLLAGLHTIEEVSDVKERICSPDLAFQPALQKLGVT